MVIVGYFSGKQRDWAALLDAAARTLEERGARVVGRIVQRRGVSAGGAKKMALPDAAVFVGCLTQRQCLLLAGVLGCTAVSLADALA